MRRDTPRPRFIAPVVTGLAVAMGAALAHALREARLTKPATVVTDPTVRMVPTSTGTMAVQLTGAPGGSPIVLVHGALSSRQWFARVIPILSREHRVINVDLLGYGDSEKPASGHYSVQDQARTLGEALDLLEVGPATLVGHSLGGAVVTSLAEQRPDLAARVAVINTSVVAANASLGPLAQISLLPLVGPNLMTLIKLVATPALFSPGFAPGYDIASGFDDPRQPLLDLQTMTWTSHRETIRSFDSFNEPTPLHTRLGNLDKPVLVIFGEREQIATGLDDDLAAYRTVPQAQLELIPEAGHSPPVETPDITASLLMHFVAS